MLLPLRKPGAACLWIALWVPRGQECRPLTPHSVNHCCVCDHRSGRTGPLELEATDRRSCPALCLRALPLGHWPGRARSWGHSPGGWAVGGGGPAWRLPWGVGGRHPTPPPPHARASVTGPFPFIASHRQFPLVLPWACEPGCPPGPSPASCGTRVSASRGSPAPEGERACLPVRGCQAASRRARRREPSRAFPGSSRADAQQASGPSTPHARGAEALPCRVGSDVCPPPPPRSSSRSCWP